MPIPSLPSAQLDSPLGGQSAMYSDSPSGQGGNVPPDPSTGDQALMQKQSSFISWHKELTQTLQTGAQAYPEFAPTAKQMLAVSKQGLVQALGEMSRQTAPEQPSGGFLS